MTIFIFEGRGWHWLPLPLSTFENFWRKNKSGLCRKRLPKEQRTQALSAFKILNQHLHLVPVSKDIFGSPLTSFISSLISFDSLYQLLSWYDGWKEGSLSERHGEPTIRPGCERKKRREASFAEEKT